jgi:L-threonylcarbamoyladenylate synthase
MTDVLPATPDGITRAVEVLRAGGLVAFPTDTVHGVACRPGDEDALARLSELKGRPPSQRIGWFVADLGQAARLGLVVDDRATRLAGAFWPGGLTLVLAAGPDALPEVSPTLGVRVPAHDTARQLLSAIGPLPQTSANPHGLPETLSTDDIRVAFAGNTLLDAVIDGASAGRVASSVVDLSVTPGRLRREGAVPRASLAELVELLPPD